MNLYQVFVHLRKVFDTVNCTGLWCILSRLECPSHFLKILESFYGGREACVSVGGVLTEPIKVENGVKQGDLLNPILFSISPAQYVKGL